MNRSHPEPESLGEDQAALWAAKLDGGSLSAADRNALDAWLAADPRHRRLLSEYCQFSADLEEQLPHLIAAGAVSLTAEAAKPKRRRATALWFATTLAAAAAIAGGVWVARPTTQTDTFATSVAQRKTLTLADGSIVELNARTSLLVEMTGKVRHVRMADGEAFFTVAKDKSRPFVVETPAGSVHVTGTVFDVHAEPTADFAVTVFEGSVQVMPGRTTANPSATAVMLHGHQQLVADADPATVRNLNDTELDDALAWRRGEIVFDGTPLQTALARFARYHGRSITAAAPVAQLRIGGRYRLDNLDEFLTAMEAVLPVRVSHEPSGAIEVTPRTGG